MKIALSPQVLSYIRRPSPEARARIRRALRDLVSGRGDVRALEEPLDGYCRLRVGNYRVVFAYTGRRTIECVFLEQRSIVYELFASELREVMLKATRRRS